MQACGPAGLDALLRETVPLSLSLTVSLAGLTTKNDRKSLCLLMMIRRRCRTWDGCAAIGSEAAFCCWKRYYPWTRLEGYASLMTVPKSASAKEKINADGTAGPPRVNCPSSMCYNAASAPLYLFFTRNPQRRHQEPYINQSSAPHPNDRHNDPKMSSSTPIPKRVSEMTPEERLESLKAWAEEQKYVRPGEGGTLVMGARSMTAPTYRYTGPVRYVPAQYHVPIAPPSYDTAVATTAGEVKKGGPVKQWLEKRKGKKRAGSVG